MFRQAHRQRELFVIATTALVIVVTLGIVLGVPKPLQFQVISGEVMQGDHGLAFASQTGIVGTPCSKNGALDGYFRRGQWGWKMHWRFEGARIPPPSLKPRAISNALPCTIEVRRIIELRVIEQ